MADTGRSPQALSARLNFAYSSVTAGLAVVGVFWFVTLILLQWWPLALMEGVMTAICVLTWLLIRSGRLPVALIVSQLAFYLVILTLCLIYDIPNAAAPRVTHLFLLAIALLGYISHIRQPSAVQLGMIGLSLATFLVFCSSNVLLPIANPLPDAVRVPGSWFNSIIALAILCGCIYTMHVEFVRSSAVVRELQAALFGNQFELFYQPQVDREARIIGAEALLRWKHPRRGYVPPAEFIPVAEQNGQMTLIGGWVLEQACRTLVEWRRNPSTQSLRLAVNVSAGQFLDPNFEQFVLDVTERAGIDRSRLKLELTESVMVVNIDLVVAKMTSLAAAGIGTALDDFGTGYSSLGYLKRMPLEQLKIDRSFVQDVLDNERSAALARSVIQLGNDLGLAVLAEGVETQAQFDFLRESGCSEFQGYLFGRPVPLGEYIQLLTRAPHGAS